MDIIGFKTIKNQERVCLVEKGHREVITYQEHKEGPMITARYKTPAKKLFEMWSDLDGYPWCENIYITFKNEKEAIAWVETGKIPFNVEFL